MTTLNPSSDSISSIINGSQFNSKTLLTNDVIENSNNVEIVIENNEIVDTNNEIIGYVSKDHTNDIYTINLNRSNYNYIGNATFQYALKEGVSQSEVAEVTLTIISPNANSNTQAISPSDISSDSVFTNDFTQKISNYINRTQVSNSTDLTQIHLVSQEREENKKNIPDGWENLVAYLNNSFSSNDPKYVLGQADKYFSYVHNLDNSSSQEKTAIRQQQAAMISAILTAAKNIQDPKVKFLILSQALIFHKHFNILPAGLRGGKELYLETVMSNSPNNFGHTNLVSATCATMEVAAIGGSIAKTGVNIIGKLSSILSLTHWVSTGYGKFLKSIKRIFPVLEDAFPTITKSASGNIPIKPITAAAKYRAVKEALAISDEGLKKETLQKLGYTGDEAVQNATAAVKKLARKQLKEGAEGISQLGYSGTNGFLQEGNASNNFIGSTKAVLMDEKSLSNLYDERNSEFFSMNTAGDLAFATLSTSSFATAGAIVGSMVMPGIGTLVGGGIGWVVGFTTYMGRNLLQDGKIFNQEEAFLENYDDAINALNEFAGNEYSELLEFEPITNSGDSSNNTNPATNGNNGNTINSNYLPMSAFACS